MTSSGETRTCDKDSDFLKIPGAKKGAMAGTAGDALTTASRWRMHPQALGPLATIALLAACAGSPKPSASPSATAPASASRPYGYEFAPDSAAIVAAEPAGADSLPTGPGGRLFSTAIQNVVRAHFGEITACYDEGRKRNPNLKGKVTVKYVIGEDGLTKEAADDGSTLPDKAVVDCVVGKFRERKYQESRGGKVTVIYPIEFAP